jgi:HTH-type transcriptional regulator, sugar sensing transcriptional regulator
MVLMAKDLLHVLEAVGLDDKEAQLYLAGLQLGAAPASDYAKKSSMNRITAYNTLESMVQRGLLTTVKKVRAKWYSPVAPEYLSLEARKSAEALDRALPELRSLQGAKYRKPRVRFFEGWDGVRRVYEDTLTAKTDILNFADSAVLRQFWANYDDEYVAQRVKRGIMLRGIAPDDEAGRKVHGEDKDRLREIRLVAPAMFASKNEINIYDHKVAICSFPNDARSTDDLFGVIIESKEAAETQRQIFEMAWRYAGITSGEKVPKSSIFKRKYIA